MILDFHREYRTTSLRSVTIMLMRISSYSLIDYQEKGAELCILFHIYSFLGQVSFISPLTSEEKPTEKTSCFSVLLSNRKIMCFSPPFLVVKRLSIIGCATTTFFTVIFLAGCVDSAKGCSLEEIRK